MDYLIGSAIFLSGMAATVVGAAGVLGLIAWHHLSTEAPVKRLAVRHENALHLPKFETEAEALGWMSRLLAGRNMSNARFAYSDDRQSSASYDAQRLEGIPSFFDAYVLVGGREARVGCNYTW